MFGAVLKLGASARIWRCSCASLPVERRPISPDFPPLPTTMDNQGFFASKGSVCWSLLVPGPGVFRQLDGFSLPRQSPARATRHVSAAIPIVPLRRPDKPAPQSACCTDDACCLDQPTLLV